MYNFHQRSAEHGINSILRWMTHRVKSPITGPMDHTTSFICFTFSMQFLRYVCQLRTTEGKRNLRSDCIHAKTHVSENKTNFADRPSWHKHSETQHNIASCITTQYIGLGAPHETVHALWTILGNYYHCAIFMETCGLSSLQLKQKYEKRLNSIL